MQLKSFVRLKDLAPGETAEAELIVNREELRYYDVISEAMLLESGDYTFMAGASSGDIRQQAVLRLEGEQPETQSMGGYGRQIDMMIMKTGVYP